MGLGVSYMLIIFDIFFVFIFGTILGSFLNMAVFRLQNQISFGKKQSFCDHCLQTLSWKDLIPIVSFLISKGKTRCCGNKLSVLYPLVELLLGISFVLSYLLFFSNTLEIVRGWIFSFIIIFVFILDARFYLVHVGAVIVFIIISGLINVFSGFSIVNLLWGMTFGCIFYGVQYFFSRGKWVGQGDIWLGVLFGVMFGFVGILVLLFFAYIIGAFVGIILIFWGKKSLKSRLPMGVFLGLGGLIALFFGDTIVQYYTSLIFL